MDHTNTREAIWRACVANDVPRLAYAIETKMTNRLTKNYGSAYYSKRMIFLSNDLYAPANKVMQYEIMVHMACHFITRFKWMRSQQYTTLPKPHGPEWRAAMDATKVPWTLAYCYTPDCERPAGQMFGCGCRKDLRFSDALTKTICASPFSCAVCDRALTLSEASNGVLFPAGIAENPQDSGT